MARVTIGVPIFNGAATLVECLECLRSQTFEDFEVLMQDNGSTDATPDICEDFARRDSRFRHVRREETVPPLENFRAVLDLSRTEYFIWRADDDLASNDHIEKLVDALDRKTDASLAVTPIRRIYTTTGRQVEYPLPTIDGNDRLSRVKANLLGCHPSWIYGLWRREHLGRDLRAIDGYAYLWAQDHLTTMAAIVNDQLTYAPEAIFIQRIMKEGNYHLPPIERLAARKAYVGMARGIIAKTSFGRDEQKALDETLERHADKRVAPWFKTYRRALKQRIKMALGLETS